MENQKLPKCEFKFVYLNCMKKPFAEALVESVSANSSQKLKSDKFNLSSVELNEKMENH
jgi:hypothetical protein